MCNFFSKKKALISREFTFQRDEKNMTAELYVHEGKFIMENVHAVEGETDSMFPLINDAFQAILDAQAVIDTEKVKADKAQEMKKAENAVKRVEKMREAYNQQAVKYVLHDEDGVFTVTKATKQAPVHIIPKEKTEKRPAVDYGFNLSTFELLRVAELIAFNNYNSEEKREKMREALTAFYTTNNLTDAGLFSFARVKALTYAANVRMKPQSHIKTVREYDPKELIAYLTFCTEETYKKFIENVEAKEKKYSK